MDRWPADQILVFDEIPSDATVDNKPRRKQSSPKQFVVMRCGVLIRMTTRLEQLDHVKWKWRQSDVSIVFVRLLDDFLWTTLGTLFRKQFYSKIKWTRVQPRFKLNDNIFSHISLRIRVTYENCVRCEELGGFSWFSNNFAMLSYSASDHQTHQSRHSNPALLVASHHCRRRLGAKVAHCVSRTAQGDAPMVAFPCAGIIWVAMYSSFCSFYFIYYLCTPKN